MRLTDVRADSVVIKVGMIGDAQIGKTSLMRFSRAPFPSFAARFVPALMTLVVRTGSSMSRDPWMKTTFKRSVSVSFLFSGRAVAFRRIQLSLGSSCT